MRADDDLFLGGWLSPVPFFPFTAAPGAVWFILKVCLVFFLIAMVKAFVPRYRYDQLMRFGWKVFLPISLGMVVLVAGVLQLPAGARAWRNEVGLQGQSKMKLDQAAKAIFLTEFVSAFMLSMRYFFKPKPTLNYPHEKNRNRRAIAANMPCGAIRTARSALSPASSARRSARPRRLRLKPNRAATTAPAAPRATISTWSSASTAASVRRPAPLTPLSKDPTILKTEL